MYRRLALVFALCCGQEGVDAEAGFSARIGESGDVLEFVDESKGQVVADQIPLHRAGNIRYFSAGVGFEERQAQYPPFSLKIVFTAGGKPFLTGVDLTIQPAKGGAAITISREQVEGPWLFVDLPSGTYDIWAVYGEQKQTLQGIQVVEGRQKTVQLQWPKDLGLSIKVPDE